MIILKPKYAEAAYGKAAAVFQEYYEKITGTHLEIVTEPSETEDTVVVGSDAVQKYVYEKLGDGFKMHYDSDDYCILSKSDNGRELLFLAGGNGRSTIYAVYDFFERRCGCHYFWDGDVIPKADTVDITGLDVTESPRFDYRATRYFAHRGLKRFQAEHWDFEDWKREIDWLSKKRLNTFMLRIGVDDLFQRAFPGVVDYPSNEEPIPERGPGFDNRTTFWDLKYRGELRKKVLAYAFECGLMHPEDCGTMTHWYSRTPIQFLEKKKPGFLAQKEGNYTENTGLVWDIFDEENLNNYWKLTETSVKEYGKPELFHTIGLAERNFSNDRRANLNLKKYAYKKIIDHISKTYPNAPLMIAAWDFVGYLEPNEVRELVKMFNPEKTIILDYTVDLEKAGRDFENWDIMGKLPWVFGLFHAYEAQNHIHGNFKFIAEKMKLADADPFCKGMAIWPEISHCDSLMLEYFTSNSWRPTGLSIEEVANKLCEDRYGESSVLMKKVWSAFLPLLELPDKYYVPLPFNMLDHTTDRHPVWQILEGGEYIHRVDFREYWEKHNGDMKYYASDIKKVLFEIANMPKSVFEKPFIRRDTVDIMKTVSFKMLQYTCAEALYEMRESTQGSDASAIKEKLTRVKKMLSALGDVLGLSEDYSMLASYNDLSKNREINPAFAEAYRENVVNHYCRTGIYEVVKGIYEKEVDVFNKWAFERLDGNRSFSYTPDLKEAKDRIFEEFMETPLESFHTSKTDDYKEIAERMSALV